MANETNVDNQVPEGAGANTNAPVSQEPGKSVADANVIAKLVEDAVAKHLKPIQGDIGGLYSRQDKDRKQLREFMDEVKKQQAGGLSEEAAFDAAQQAMSRRAEAEEERRMLREIHERLFTGSPAGNGAETNAQRLAKELGMDLNDKDVSEAVRSGDVVKVAQVAKSKQSVPSADESDALPLLGGEDAPKKEVQALTADYIKEMRSAQGNRNLLNATREKYKKLGVDIYNQDFS